MGIHGLTKLLGDNAPSCMKENEIKNYFGTPFWYIGYIFTSGTSWVNRVVQAKAKVEKARVIVSSGNKAIVEFYL